MFHEIETLMKEIAEFYLSQPGVIDVKYIKRTYHQEDFNAVKSCWAKTQWAEKREVISLWKVSNTRLERLLR